MTSREPVHLSSRDRLALAFRIAGALAGLVIVVLGFATSSWNSARVIVPFSVVVVGGATAWLAEGFYWQRDSNG